MKIGVDLDGVCYDFTSAFCDYVGAPKDFVATRWQFYEDLGFTTEQFLELCRNAVRQQRLFRYGYLLPGTKEAFDALRAMGHTIHIVTDRCSIDPSRSQRIRQATELWLDNNGLICDTLHFTGDKATIAKELELDFFIDDRTENVEALEAAGFRAYLFDRPWNQQSLMSRVWSWDEFVQTVQHVSDMESSLTDEHVGCDCNERLNESLTRLAQDSQEVRVTSATGGQKGQKLARIGSLDPKALMEVAKVAGFGEQKYSRLNYLNGYDWSLSYDACQRHLHAFWSGEDLDPESGLPHLAHAAWHCLAMLAFLTHELGTDDRYRKDAA